MAGPSPTTFHWDMHPKFHYFTKLRNTFLYDPWWRLLVWINRGFWAKAAHVAEFSTPSPRLGAKLWNKLAQFFGRSSNDLVYCAQEYKIMVNFDPTSQVLIDEIASRASDLDAPILDLGCNSGRNTNALANLGFTALYGVDIARDALDYMYQAFPGAAEKAHMTHGSFQQYLAETPNQFFEILFANGVIEDTQPVFPLVRQLARVTRAFVILCIMENQGKYPRFWIYEFEREGFVLVKLLRPAAEPAHDHSQSLLVFRSERKN